MAQLAAIEAGELLALTRHLRPRLVPGEEPPAAAVAERIVQMDGAELRELGRRLQERLAAEAEQAGQEHTAGVAQKTLRVEICASARRQRADTLVSLS